MSIRESDRTELHLKLKDLLGNNMAEVLMEHLPPSGWGDVARKSDIDQLSILMDAKFQAIETSMDARLGTIETSTTAKFQAIETLMDARLGTIETSTTAKFQAIETLMDTKFSTVEVRFNAIDARFNAVDQRFEYVENTLRGVQHGLWALASLMSACFIATFTILVTQL